MATSDARPVWPVSKRALENQLKPSSFLRSFAFLLGALAPFPLPARADFFSNAFDSFHTEKKGYRVALAGSGYLSQQNFDAAGTLTPVSGLTSYQRLTGSVTAQVAVSARLSLFGRLQWVRTEYQRASAPLGGSSFGLSDQTVGATFRLVELDGIGIDLQIQGDFPLYSNSAAASASLPFLGDASSDLTGGLFLDIPLTTSARSSWVLRGGAGFTYRTESFSSAIPWTVLLGHERTTSGMIGSLSAQGMISLRTDPRGATGATETVGLEQAGGSFWINAINPSMVRARVNVGYQLSPSLGLTAFAALPVWGQAAPFGTQGGIQLTLQSNPDIRSRDYNHSNRGLVSYRNEGHVTQTNERLGQIKIDLGTDKGVESNQVWDVFAVRKDGLPGEAIARARVIQTSVSESTLQVVEYFKEVWIEEGAVVRQPVQ